ncbi:MAG: PHP domain-containing protein [Bacteroidales bacterium]|nr:PHP domain-containing protein [Bacteroidales bacterium]
MNCIVDVNAHMHTPYSFSAFADVRQALDMAAQEGVKVVGINDFYSLDGYQEWSEECAKRQLYPLFNIEMIALNSEDQAKGLRVNDPNNPGRTYLSGKGLAFPVILSGKEAQQLADVKAESNAQVAKMCAKLNDVLNGVKAGFNIDFADVTRKLTCGSIRERHLAKALRLAVDEHFSTSEARLDFYERLCKKPLKSALDNVAAVENELRGNLLKAGGAAFVPEDAKAFLPLETVQRIMEAAGGIPTYPFLADDAKGNFTDFEADLQQCADTLKRRGIRSVEFITTRNTTAVLESYASYLEDEGFIVTFGSEHNTPAIEPIRLRTRDNAELSEKLRAINFRGACLVAAHQVGKQTAEEGAETIYKSIGI